MPKIKARKKKTAPPVEAPNIPSTGGLPEAPEAEAQPDTEIPEPVELDMGRWVNTVPVIGGADMDVFALDSGLIARRGGVAGTDELPEIPELVVPFEGYMVPMGLVIKESNGLAGDRVVGICKWQITMNGELAYAPLLNPRTLRDALFDAGWAVQRLVEQMERDGVRWWDQRTWMRRRVTIGPVTCIVVGHAPQTGEISLLPADGSSTETVDIDILDHHLHWLPLEEPDGSA